MFDEFYLKIRPSDFWLLYAKKLQIFFSIFMMYSKIFKPNFWFFCRNVVLLTQIDPL